MKIAKILLASAVVAGTLGVAAPSFAQRVTIGPDGPGVDFRNREQRMRDREEAREDRNYRQQRYRDNDRGSRRGYDY